MLSKHDSSQPRSKASPCLAELADATIDHLCFFAYCFPTDPEEFIAILFQRVLHMDPLLKIRYKTLPVGQKCHLQFFSPERHYCNVILSSHIRSNGDSGLSQDAYTYQIILEKNDVGPCPSVQQLIETSFNSCDLKFEEVSETEVKLEVRWRPRAVKTFALPSVQTFNTSYTKTILDHMTYFPCFNHPFVVGPIVPHGSDAKIWKKLQDVSLRHSLYRTWYHRPLTSMWVPNGQSFL